MKSDDRLDQLSVIFSVIGTPSPEDIMAVGKANKYIDSLPKTKFIEKCGDWDELLEAIKEIL